MADGAAGLRSGGALPALGDAAGEQRSERTDDKLLQDLQSVHVTTLRESRWLRSARGASGPHRGSARGSEAAADI